MLCYACAMLERPRRILLKGTSGAGKSTLGRQLAELLAVPYVELDALHHGPSWSPAGATELQARVRAVVDNADGWVVDGNYGRKLGTLVIDRAELIVWLDLPLPTKLRRLVRRTWLRYHRQEELWNGNREGLATAFWGREALFPWTVRSHFEHRRSWPRELSGRRLVRLRSAREVAEWLSSFNANAAPHRW